MKPSDSVNSLHWPRKARRRLGAIWNPCSLPTYHSSLKRATSTGRGGSLTWRRPSVYVSKEGREGKGVTGLEAIFCGVEKGKSQAFNEEGSCCFVPLC